MYPWWKQCFISTFQGNISDLCYLVVIGCIQKSVDSWGWVPLYAHSIADMITTKICYVKWYGRERNTSQKQPAFPWLHVSTPISLLGGKLFHTLYGSIFNLSRPTILPLSLWWRLSVDYSRPWTGGIALLVVCSCSGGSVGPDVNCFFNTPHVSVCHSLHSLNSLPVNDVVFLI